MNELSQSLDVLGARVLGPVVEGLNAIARDLLAISRLDFSNLNGDWWKVLAGGTAGAVLGAGAGPAGIVGGFAAGAAIGIANIDSELEKLERSIAEYEKKLTSISRKQAVIRPEIGLADTFQREFDEYRQKLIEAKKEMMRLTASTTVIDSAGDWAAAQTGAIAEATDSWDAYVATTKQVFGLSSEAAKNLASLGDAFENASKKFGVPKELLISIANFESAFDQMAKSGDGAIGVMQIMPNTMKEIAAETGITIEQMMTDANKNVEAGAYYLKKTMTQMGGDLQKGLAGYNWGPYRKLLQQPGDLDTGKLPAETQQYLDKVVGGYEKLSAAMGDFGPMADRYKTNMEQLNDQERERARVLEEARRVEEARKASLTELGQSVEYLAASYDYLYGVELQHTQATQLLTQAEAEGVITAERRLALMEQVAAQTQRMKDGYIATTASIEGLTLRMKDAVFASFNSWIDSAVQGTFNLKDALGDLLKQIVALTVKMAVFKAVSSAFGGTDFSGMFGLQAAQGYAFPGGTSLPQGIYHDPTVFKFAKGGTIGLMGEAGSEAILPLTRTSNGDLGVKGQPVTMNVNVVNNNRSAEVVSRQIDEQTIEITIKEIESRLQRGGNSTSRVFDSRYRR
jgi:soluble lytic murein transglycosylase-like protein